MSIFLVNNTNNRTGMFCFIFKTTLGVCVVNYSFSVKPITLLSFTRDLIKKKSKTLLVSQFNLKFDKGLQDHSTRDILNSTIFNVI